MAGLSLGSSDSESDALTGQSRNYDSGYRDASAMRQGVWDPSGAAYGQMAHNLQNQYLTTQQMRAAQDPATIQRMNAIQQQAHPYWQQQMQGGAYSNLGMGNRLANSLDQSMNTPSQESQINASIMGGTGNNYADAMKSQYMQDASQAQQQMMSNMDARAAAAGMSGGSRHGLATAMGNRDINRNLQGNLANTGYQTFDKDLDRKLGIAQRADTNDLERQRMMMGMLGNEQQTRNQGLMNAQVQQNLGMGQYMPEMVGYFGMNQYANALGRPVVLGSGEQDNSGFNRGQSYYVSDQSSDSGGWGAGFGI